MHIATKMIIKRSTEVGTYLAFILTSNLTKKHDEQQNVSLSNEEL